jgi:hypothetical protein
MKKAFLFAALILFAAGLAFGGTITVSEPAGGSFAMGAACPVHWTFTGTVGNVKIQLIRPGGGLVGLLAGRLAPDNSPYPWVVASPAEAGQNYRIRVSAVDGSCLDESAEFSVTAAGDPGDPGDPGTPGAITVTDPNAGTSWRPESRQTITWTKSGNLPTIVQVTLRREGAPETEDPVVRIADGCANNGSHIWFVPGDLAEGRYFVRVRAAATIRGDSATFAIDAEGARSAPAGPDTPIRAELEMPGVGVEYYNGNIVAWVKNNGPDSVRDHNIKFRLHFPEGGRGEQIINRMISLPVGSEEGVPLLAMVRSAIPETGLRTLVRIDTALSHISDPNPLNQHRDVRIFSETRPPLDLSIALYSRDTNISYVLLDAGGAFSRRYRIRATMRLRNNSDSPAEIARVKCNWRTQSRNTDEIAWGEGYPLSSGSLQLGPFRRGEETTCAFEFDFIIHDYHDVVFYRVMFELDPDHLLNDPNRGNNIAVTGQFDHD